MKNIHWTHPQQITPSCGLRRKSKSSFWWTAYETISIDSQICSYKAWRWFHSLRTVLRSEKYNTHLQYPVSVGLLCQKFLLKNWMSFAVHSLYTVYTSSLVSIPGIWTLAFIHSNLWSLDLSMCGLFLPQPSLRVCKQFWLTVQ